MENFGECCVLGASIFMCITSVLFFFADHKRNKSMDRVEHALRDIENAKDAIEGLRELSEMSKGGKGIAVIKFNDNDKINVDVRLENPIWRLTK